MTMFAKRDLPFRNSSGICIPTVVRLGRVVRIPAPYSGGPGFK